MDELLLAGCSTRPLGSYLKALGVFRLVTEQHDSSATGSWPADTFALSSRADRDELVRFFLEEYRPTPIVSPWNGSSGFDDRAVPEVDRILDADDQRLALYQQTIRQARAVAEAASWEALDKEGRLLRCRAELPDEAVAWLDAAVVLTDDGPAYPPLLGTGGNLGRLELSRNFMGHLARVLGLETGRGAPGPDDSRAWLAKALFDEGDPPLVQQSIAQFDPGAAGGANMAPTGKADSVVNPWEYVLILEGALLFASAVARRLGSDSGGGTAALPFTTRATPVGYTSNADEPAKGELWTPVWQRPITLPELAHLLGEGRASWRGRQARTGLDFARAVATLGIDRGIDRFVRHAFVERLGQMTLAVPVGVVAVRERPEVSVLGQLDEWLGRVQGLKNPPAGISVGVRRTEHAMFAVATAGGALRLQRVLAEAALLHDAVRRSPSARDRIPPLTDLLADDWLPRLDDGSEELAVAAGLASARDRDTSLRLLLTGVTVDARRRAEWSPRPPDVVGLGARHIADVLGDALCRLAVGRSRGDDRTSGPGSLDHVGHGVDLGFAFQRSTPISAVLDTASGRLDALRLSTLLSGLLLLDWRTRDEARAYHPEGSRAPTWIGPAAAIFLPFFHGRPVEIGGRDVLLRVEPSWPRLLAAGRVAEVLADAVRRLRMAGLPAAPVDPRAAAADQDGRWLSVAALCRLGHADARSLIAHACPPDPDRRRD